MKRALEVAECLNARFCHDLAGNIGATVSGTEFIEGGSEEIRGQALHLLQASSSRLMSLLEFYRTTFSTTRNNGEADLETLRNICIKYVENPKVKLQFLDKYLHIKDASICVSRGKILCCLAAIISSSLVHGGTVDISIAKQDSGSKIKLVAVGNNIRASKEAQEVFAADNIDECQLLSKNIFAFYARSLAEDIGVNITSNNSETAVEYIVF